MKKYIFAFLLAMLTFAVQAQQLVVTSFEKMERDMDARIKYPLKDFNGKICAIIKVENTNTGFDFDTGTLQVQKVEQQPGEIWVYVQPGVRKMTIRHPQLGVLREYIFPCSIDEATVYVMKLQSGSVETIVTPNRQATGYLIVKSEPSDAQVWIGGEWLGNTPFQKKYPIGEKLGYRIKKDMYHDEIGNITVDQTQTKIDAKLQPAFGSLTVTSQPSGATVYIDRSSQSAGTTPLTIPQIASGKHTIMAQLPMYSPTEAEVTVADGQTASSNINLSARFADITVTSLPGAEIEINGKKAGTGTATSREGEGLCDIKATLAGHRDAVRQITVEAGKNQSITLNPTPIYGSLSVESNPIEADIYIDGKHCGTTPNIIPELLVGKHTVKLSKSGCADYSQTIEIAEGREATVMGELPTGKQYTVRSQADGDKIYIDGAYAGVSPLTTTLAFGDHSLYAMRGDKKSSVKGVSVSPASAASEIALGGFGKESFTVNGVTFNMIEVAGGTFTMGATSEQGSDAGSDEKPAHQVTLSDYMIGETEVTQELWQAVMGTNPSSFKSGSNLPVEYVSWNDCKEFCEKLSQLTGKNFRLPTEAEWEYAARGGNKSQGYKYSGSNDIGTVAWDEFNSSSKTHPVATKASNELGLYDMSGNVWEWCSDWKGSYTSGSATNPTGPASGSRRVYRGGSWGSCAVYCRVAYRGSVAPVCRYDNFGLRLAL